MICLPVWIDQERGHERTRQGCTEEVCVVERVHIHNEAFNGFVFYVGLNLTGYNALLHQWLLA